MKRAILPLILAGFVVMSGRAQTPPNLSGTWRPQNPMAGQANPFEFTITQTADSVTIRTPLSNPDTVTFHQNAETRTPIAAVSAEPAAPRKCPLPRVGTAQNSR